jgi:hypothetical protein
VAALKANNIDWENVAKLANKFVNKNVLYKAREMLKNQNQRVR